MESLDTILGTIKTGENLRGGGQTKDSSRERRLSGPYSKKSGLKKAYILSAGSKGIM